MKNFETAFFSIRNHQDNFLITDVAPSVNERIDEICISKNDYLLHNKKIIFQNQGHFQK